MRPSSVTMPDPTVVADVYAMVVPAWSKVADAAALVSPRGRTFHAVPCACDVASRSVQMISLLLLTLNIESITRSPVVQWALLKLGAYCCWRARSADAPEPMYDGTDAVPSTLRSS